MAVFDYIRLRIPYLSWLIPAHAAQSVVGGRLSRQLVPGDEGWNALGAYYRDHKVTRWLVGGDRRLVTVVCVLMAQMCWEGRDAEP